MCSANALILIQILFIENTGFKQQGGLNILNMFLIQHPFALNKVETIQIDTINMEINVQKNIITNVANNLSNESIRLTTRSPQAYSV